MVIFVIGVCVSWGRGGGGGRMNGVFEDGGLIWKLRRRRNLMPRVIGLRIVRSVLCHAKSIVLLL